MDLPGQAEFADDRSMIRRKGTKKTFCCHNTTFVPLQTEDVVKRGALGMG